MTRCTFEPDNAMRIFITIRGTIDSAAVGLALAGPNRRRTPFLPIHQIAKLFSEKRAAVRDTNRRAACPIVAEKIACFVAIDSRAVHYNFGGSDKYFLATILRYGDD